MSKLSSRKTRSGCSAGSHDDARASLRRLVNATSANLAEMDRLLERAERLLLREFVTRKSLTSCSAESALTRRNG